MNTLFHFTSPKNALSIVGSGKFHLSIASGSDAEEEFSQNRLFFLSTTRTLSNIFAIRTNGGSEVLFVLDANKIRSRFKVVPVDFWQNGADYSESEERIISDKPDIDISIVKEIHCNVGTKEEARIKSNGMYFRGIALQARKRNIPVYFYGSKKDMLSRRPTKRISLFNEITSTLNGKETPEPDNRPDFIKDIEKEKEARQKEDLYPFLVLLHAAIRKDFSGIKTFSIKSDVHKYFQMLRSINSGFRTRQTVVSELSRRLLNARQFGGVGSQQLKYAEAFIMLAKRNGLTMNAVPDFIANRIAETVNI
ncbi:hypothetical protein JA13_138 [Dickeya phage vB_DsoM_JA13]|uniref:Uncharacterized protein n=1 Tax=Dickeya phage vB_DsoM_JA13 TaxID=2283030 RepID=A0A384ZWD2_9CAUD|nr:hypothetical protein JA13_138 [Dickeya phage vB_DsoM_JA13]